MRLKKEYTFDVKLFTTIRVEALNEADARKIVSDNIHGDEANFGAWPNGDPIIAEVCVDDDEMQVIEVDGEAV